jgi:hypothetical protein
MTITFVDKTEIDRWLKEPSTFNTLRGQYKRTLTTSRKILEDLLQNPSLANRPAIKEAWDKMDAADADLRTIHMAYTTAVGTDDAELDASTYLNGVERENKAVMD